MDQESSTIDTTLMVWASLAIGIACMGIAFCRSPSALQRKQKVQAYRGVVIGQFLPTLLVGAFAVAFFYAVMVGADVHTVGIILAFGFITVLVEAISDRARR